MKRCMYCGQENEDSAQTCVKCGNRLIDTPTISPDELGEDVQEMPDAVAEGADTVTDTAEEAADIAVEEIPVQVSEEAAVEEQEPAYGDAQQAEEFGGVSGDTQEIPAPGYMAEAARSAAQEYEYGPEDGQQYDTQNYGYDQGYDYDQADGQAQYGGQSYGYDENGYQYDMNQDPNFQAGGRRNNYTSVGPLMKKARKRVKSFLSFLAVLLYTVVTAAGVLNIATGGAVRNLSTVYNTISSVTGPNAAVNFMQTVITLINSFDSRLVMAALLVLSIPGILFMVGLWMVFSQTSRRKMEISTSGFTMIKAMTIIRFILVCLVLLAAILGSVAFVVAAGASSSVMSMIVGIILLLVVVIVSVLTIMYYVQALYTIKVVRVNVRTGEDIGRIPGYIVFIGFFSCICTVLTMLPMAPDDYIGLAFKGALAVYQLLMTLWIIVYRAKVRTR